MIYSKQKTKNGKKQVKYIDTRNDSVIATLHSVLSRYHDNSIDIQMQCVFLVGLFTYWLLL